MQKQKIKSFYLVLSSDYTMISVALCSGNSIIQQHSQEKITASASLMVIIHTLLIDNNVDYADLMCIGVNCGPGPFTTLRVLITTANGLLCAHTIPLVFVDGLEAFLLSYKVKKDELAIALLNAFNEDVYYGVKQEDHIIETGCDFYGTFLQKCKENNVLKKIIFMGNAAFLYKEVIQKIFFESSIEFYVKDSAFIEDIQKIVYAKIIKEEMTLEPLLPLYLKTLTYTAST